MSGRKEPTLLEIAEAWDALNIAICRVEVAQPVNMSAAVIALRDERLRFEDLILCRTPKDSAHDR